MIHHHQISISSHQIMQKGKNVSREEGNKKEFIGDPDILNILVFEGIWIIHSFFFFGSFITQMFAIMEAPLASLLQLITSKWKNSYLCALVPRCSVLLHSPSKCLFLKLSWECGSFARCLGVSRHFSFFNLHGHPVSCLLELYIAFVK